MNSSIEPRMIIIDCAYQGVTGYNFQIKSVYFMQSLEIGFILANCANPDEMPHHAAFHLGLHCECLIVKVLIKGVLHICQFKCFS